MDMRESQEAKYEKLPTRTATGSRKPPSCKGNAKKFAFRRKEEPKKGVETCKKSARRGDWTITERAFLSPGEVERLRASLLARIETARPMPGRVAMLEWITAEIALQTGLRVGELAALAWGDFIDRESGGSVLVRRGKGGKSRLVKFGQGLAEALARYRAWKDERGESTEPDVPLFFSPGGPRAISKRAIQKMFARAQRRAGLEPRRFHALRHTYASQLYRASSHNLRMVQKQLGHASIRTTQIYADVLDGETEKAVDQLYRAGSDISPNR